MSQYINGIFFGALILCIFMLNFPAQKTCEVKINHGNGNVSNVQVGVWNE